MKRIIFILLILLFASNPKTSFAMDSTVKKISKNDNEFKDSMTNDPVYEIVSSAGNTDLIWINNGNTKIYPYKIVNNNDYEVSIEVYDKNTEEMVWTGSIAPKHYATIHSVSPNEILKLYYFRIYDLRAENVCENDCENDICCLPDIPFEVIVGALIILGLVYAGIMIFAGWKS